MATEQNSKPFDLFDKCQWDLNDTKTEESLDDSIPAI